VAKFDDKGTPVTYTVDIPRYPWEDMEEGEDTRGTYSVDFYNDTLPFNGAIVVGLVGVEVDSESAAEKNIESWDAAFLEYLKEVSKAVGLIGTSGVAWKDIIGKLGVTNSIYLAIIIAVIILVIGIIWADWAPADPVLVDFIALNSSDLYNMTNAREPVGGFYSPKRLSSALEVTILPEAKRFETRDSVDAEYREKRRYTMWERDFLTAAREYHVESEYEMLFHYKRNP
jgi:hypothetical protein